MLVILVFLQTCRKSPVVSSISKLNYKRVSVPLSVTAILEFNERTGGCMKSDGS